MQGQVLDPATREKGQSDIREFLKRKRELGEDTTALSAVLGTLPETFVFSLISGDFIPDENESNMEQIESNPEMGITETTEDQQYFFQEQLWHEEQWYEDQSNPEMGITDLGCSPCYSDPSLQGFENILRFWEGPRAGGCSAGADACGDPGCRFRVQGHVSESSSQDTRILPWSPKTAVGPSSDTPVINKAGEQRDSRVACTLGGPRAAAGWVPQVPFVQVQDYGVGPPPIERSAFPRSAYEPHGVTAKGTATHSASPPAGTPAEQWESIKAVGLGQESHPILTEVPIPSFNSTAEMPIIRNVPSGRTLAEDVQNRSLVVDEVLDWVPNPI